MRTQQVFPLKHVARCGLVLACAGISRVCVAGPAVCLDTITDVELVHRIKQDAYFTHNAPLGRNVRIEYDGCGYRIRVGDEAPNSHRSDLLLVDSQGRVTQVIHQGRQH